MDGSERQASFSFQCTSSWFESFEPLDRKKFLCRTNSNKQHKILLWFFPYILFQIKLICEQKIKQLEEIFRKKFSRGEGNFFICWKILHLRYIHIHLFDIFFSVKLWFSIFIIRYFFLRCFFFGLFYTIRNILSCRKQKSEVSI